MSAPSVRGASQREPGRSSAVGAGAGEVGSEPPAGLIYRDGHKRRDVAPPTPHRPASSPAPPPPAAARALRAGRPRGWRGRWAGAPARAGRAPDAPTPDPESRTPRSGPGQVSFVPRTCLLSPKARVGASRAAGRGSGGPAARKGDCAGSAGTLPGAGNRAPRTGPSRLRRAAGPRARPSPAPLCLCAQWGIAGSWGAGPPPPTCQRLGLGARRPTLRGRASKTRQPARGVTSPPPPGSSLAGRPVGIRCPLWNSWGRTCSLFF